MEERRGDLIDRAYRMDKDFASSLAAVTDDEPAKKRLERDVSLCRVKDALGHKKVAHDDPQPADGKDCSKAAWWQLGELNAQRAQPIPVSRTLDYMRYAAIQPVGDAYPIFAWAIENAIRRAESDKGVRPVLVNLFEACLRGAELAGYAAMRPGASRATMTRYADQTTSTAIHSAPILIRDGQREEALRRIKEWVIEVAPKELFIIDPFFRPDDVSILKLIQGVAEDCTIVILTDRRVNDRGDDDAYRAAWRRLSAQDPPPVTIILVTTVGGKFPAHDRWWLTDGRGGIYMGASLGGLGKRWSEMRFDGAEVANHTLSELSSLLNQTKKEFEGERVYYSTIKL
jgi:hypothetical protein